MPNEPSSVLNAFRQGDIDAFETLFRQHQCAVYRWIMRSLGVLQFTSHSLVWFQACSIPYTWVVPSFLAAMAGYYLVWKYIIGFINRVLGIA